MFEIDISASEKNCCFCGKTFLEDIEEHQNQCPDQFSLSPYKIKKRLLTRQLDNMTNQYEIAVSKLCSGDTVPVKNELGEDFCHNCATYEEHKRDNCLKMTRMEAFEALLPKMRYDWLNIKYQLVYAKYDHDIEVAEKEAETMSLHENGEISQWMLGFMPPSSLSHPTECGEEDGKESSADRLKKQKEQDAKRRRDLHLRMAEVKFEIFVRKTEAELNASERSNPTGRIIRFHSTYEKNQQRPDTQIKMMCIDTLV